MRVSVALCTYNGAAYLAEQLASIHEQTRLPDELVVRDDGSTDDTLAILDDFQRRAAFTVNITQNAQNLGSNRNFGAAIGQTTGDVIVLADQDDVWVPHKLATLTASFQRYPDVGVVYSDGWIVDGDLRKTGQTMWGTLEQRVDIHDNSFRNLLRHNHITGAMMALRASLKPLVLPTSQFWVHDHWIVLLASLVTDFHAIAEPLVLYRQHGANQIGLAHSAPLWSRIQRAVHIPDAAYSAAHHSLADLLARIDAHALPITPADRQQVLAKQAHWHARATLPRNSLQRTRHILREVAAGNYQRYSHNGRLSALRDWLAPFFQRET